MDIAIDPAAWLAYLQLCGKRVSPDDRTVIHDALASVQANFPGALSNDVFMAMFHAALEGKGFTPELTLFATSLCPDEICHEEGDLPDQMYKHFGESFSMGGLGGLPFTGPTGWNAFAHHIPAQGHVMLLYGPHVAISPTGEVGKYLRPGQAEVSTACGAVIGGWGAVHGAGGKLGAPDPDSPDQQFQYITQYLASQYEEIKGHPKGHIVGATLNIFQKAKLMLHRNIDRKLLHGGKLILLGGVQINMPQPLSDFFLPLHFELIELDGSTDLLPRMQLAQVPDLRNKADDEEGKQPEAAAGEAAA